MKRSMTRKPTHAGVFLKEHMDAAGLSQEKTSKLIGVGVRTINEIVNEKRGVSANMALRLSKLFGVSEDFWLNVQNKFDLWIQREIIKSELEEIHPLAS